MVALGKWLLALALIAFIGGLVRVVLTGDASILVVGVVLMLTIGVAGALMLWLLGEPSKPAARRVP